ncbi:ZIP Zinc transporter [Colletotrichum graminicola]|uniref:ZIP Zinc transporter n=1 Tax=Colletotrichum graminicola (strain M1.001 / M2 / FGSC 10212) TaxID=645133 RepID=E3QCC5_COLGM|nr:ZIP Zinc transporter [Colletotrichum graminicola M1.001]EFQ28513.1 ZIP Zinc transporter [Colletotrichum graminicola M1.001]WDK16016.1 ZIP Zinc transporter [Colletotrichum graminicola]
MEATEVDNDTRGWIMCIVSGMACVVGASIICVDLLVRYIPGKRNFRIQDSNGFLACSLSLSFGVMLYSALNNMLPSAKKYLKDDGFQDQLAGFLMMACFIGGFVGIQVISRLLHQYMPSHVVDCDHTHDHGENDFRSRSLSRQTSTYTSSRRSSRRPLLGRVAKNGHATESTPLLNGGVPQENGAHLVAKRHTSSRTPSVNTAHSTPARTSRSRGPTADRRPSMAQVQQRVMSFVKDTKTNCDEDGPCFGYTDPCGQECFKHLSNRTTTAPRHPSMLRTSMGSFNVHSHADLDDLEEGGPLSDPPTSGTVQTSRATSREPLSEHHETDHHGHGHNAHGDAEHMGEDVEAQHHHHVPTNAFLSLGLQTSIAIALHKFPEGFITYATNHANPTLGFNVFMALFVHNITEGFAMALPLYMALGSRLKAMVWSALLGGFSQPLGAGIAVLWLKLAKHTCLTPTAVAYACMFAITAGIMVSVGLQLFVEALSLNHNRNLCIFFGFMGMALLGITGAIASTH